MSNKKKGLLERVAPDYCNGSKWKIRSTLLESIIRWIQIIGFSVAVLWGAFEFYDTVRDNNQTLKELIEWAEAHDEKHT